MIVTVERLPDCKATMRVEVPADTVSNERTEILKAFSQQAKIPGFRPGKVPQKVIEQRFGKNIESELEERIIRSGLQEGIKNEELEVLNVSNIVDTSHNNDGTFTFTAELVMAPEFELPDYMGIPVKAPPTEVTDEQLGEAMDQLRERFADYGDVEDRALQMGDFAVLDYKGTVDGKSIGEVAPEASAHLAQNHGHWLKMDEGSFLPHFCDGLVGANKGETRNVTVTGPEDFPVEVLRGCDIVYEVTVNEIKEQQLPELNDELADKIESGKTLEEVQGNLRESMQKDREQRLDVIITNQIIDYLNQNMDFELPADLVTQETQSRVNDIVEENTRRGMEDEKIEEARDEIIQAASQQAKMSVKTSFVLKQIAEREKIEPSQEKILQRIAQLAAQYKTPVKKLMKQLQKSDGIGRIRNNVLISDTLEFLKENASVEVIEPPAEGDA